MGNTSHLIKQSALGSSVIRQLEQFDRGNITAEQLVDRLRFEAEVYMLVPKTAEK